MNMHMLGEITLSISTVIYFIWFVPQLWLNFKRKNTEGLSYWMHGLLLFGYMADLMYGFGRDMQWQYRLVTVVGLLSLFIEHYQIGRYGLHSKGEVVSYALITLVFVALLAYAIDNVSLVHRSKHFYDTAGMVSNVCWFSYMLPQIVKNYLNKSTEGLSLYFVLIAVLITVCDLTSALALNWDWPSLVGAPLTLLKKSVLLFQCWWYRGRRLKQ